jgi:hypothetical protein
MLSRALILLACIALCIGVLAQVPEAKKPAVLILGQEGLQALKPGDFAYYQELTAHGFQVDVAYSKERPITWDLLKQYNCLLLTNLPLPQETPGTWDTWKGPPHRQEFLDLLQRYFHAGGGILMLLNSNNCSPNYENMSAYLAPWGAKLPVEDLYDPINEATHPRDLATFIHTKNIAPSPVSAGVRGIWFPVRGTGGNHNFDEMGQPIEVDQNWTPVVRGADTCYAQELKPAFALRDDELFTRYVRPGKTFSPTLYAIREFGGGRMALSVCWDVFHIAGGTSWIHDRVMLGNGMHGKPGDFNVLLENTLRWLSAPSLEKGTLGGYVQDPKVLVHPNKRKKPEDYFPQFDGYQNPTPPGTVYRGLVGARTAVSGGSGTVADYAAAATRAGLDFVVFLEDFTKINEADYRAFEAECKRLSTDTLLLLPGLRLVSNIGNPMFGIGEKIPWPKPSQLDGPKKDRLRLQCFTDKGELYYNDEDAKNWIWQLADARGTRNIGYYDFSNNPGVPIRNLRLYGMLGVMTYRDGKLVEDRTAEYLDYVTDGDPPLACAVDLVDSPAALEAAVKAGHYLTHVAAPSLARVPVLMHYGHQYGRANVYPSSGPRIKCWAETIRVMTYAGESFIPARARIRPHLWVTAEAGLKEVVIYSETRPFRRFLLNGAKEFDQQFEWAFDRQRELTVVATDVNGGRAVSATLEVWNDGNLNTWCSDRQNGELWHGAATFPGPRRPEFVTGPTWDGGPTAYIGAEYDVHPGLQLKAGDTHFVEGWIYGSGGRWMEGNMYPTCFDDSVANVAIDSDGVYAPGVVANAYHTLGPSSPSKYLQWSLRRTQFLQRTADVSDIHPMYAGRVGGNLAVLDGSMTLKAGAEVLYANAMRVQPVNFQKGASNQPLWAVCGDTHTPPALGMAESYWHGSGIDVPALQPGGYLALLPTQAGNMGMVFNIGTEPVQAVLPYKQGFWQLRPTGSGPHTAGDRFTWRLLVVNDALDEKGLNLQRVEKLHRYLGLTGENGCGLKLRQGTVRSQFGLIDLQPQDGVLDFEIPNPGWRVNIPLGMRILGLNPNWTVGQWQISGYTPGFYTNGRNVYRNLALDDRGVAHLAVYPDYANPTRSIVGHPVQCGNPALIIEVVQLSSKPTSYRVAVNNPTDAPITTVLTKTMNLPGFTFPDTPVTVPAGGYLVVLEK